MSLQQCDVVHSFHMLPQMSSPSVRAPSSLQLHFFSSQCVGSGPGEQADLHCAYSPSCSKHCIPGPSQHCESWQFSWPEAHFDFSAPSSLPLLALLSLPSANCTMLKGDNCAPWPRPCKCPTKASTAAPARHTPRTERTREELGWAARVSTAASASTFISPVSRTSS